MKFKTDFLLNLCRHGVKLQNQAADTAAREVLSWIVFSSLLEEETEVSDELNERVKLLKQAKMKPLEFPKDMEDEVEPEPEGDGPMVA